MLATALVCVGVPSPASAQSADYAEADRGDSIADFYEARGGRPLWLANGGSSVEATMLIDMLRSAGADGLDPERYRPRALLRALRTARNGSPAAVRNADLLLSQAFAAYVRDLRHVPDVGIVWVDPELKPKADPPRQLLEAAAGAPSLQNYIAGMGWMNPIYAGLRSAIANGIGGAADSGLLRLNLERARALPSGNQRYIMVNATAAVLTAYENGQIVDSMRVVVGKPKNPTPMMAAYIRFASLNPYWYVPPDLAAERIAPNVVKDGLPYLKAQGYQLMSDWTESASVLDPSTVDWQAVADGTQEVRIRQLPGTANAMGKMKFMFPNSQGIYLHDTPQKELLSEASRLFSGGCVRLEDAPRLARWMFGRPLKASSKQPELKVDLPSPLPVFITYLTVMPSGTDLATFPDVYGRDRDEMARVTAATSLARR